jgi:prepilin-type N-terminal cleavage/methylation domain-containing protein
MISNNNLPDQAGFTIVELLITLVVGAVMIMGLNSIVVSQSYLVERSRDAVIANSFIEAKVEALRSLGFSGLTDGSTNITAEMPSELNTPRSASVVISSDSAAIKRAVISITFNEQGNARSYSYTTLIGELGVGQY